MATSSDHARKLAASLRTEGETSTPSDAQGLLITATYSALDALNRALFDAWLKLYNAGAYADAERVNRLRGYIGALQIDLNRRLIAALDADLKGAAKQIGDINKQLDAVAKATDQGAKDDAKVTAVLDQLAKLIGWVKDA